MSTPMTICTVGLKGLDGVDSIVHVDVYHDMGNNGMLMYQLKIQIYGRFGRLRNFGKKSGKPIYNEITSEEFYQNG